MEITQCVHKQLFAPRPGLPRTHAHATLRCTACPLTPPPLGARPAAPSCAWATHQPCWLQGGGPTADLRGPAAPGAAAGLAVGHVGRSDACSRLHLTSSGIGQRAQLTRVGQRGAGMAQGVACSLPHSAVTSTQKVCRGREGPLTKFLLSQSCGMPGTCAHAARVTWSPLRCADSCAHVGLQLGTRSDHAYTWFCILSHALTVDMKPQRAACCTLKAHTAHTA
jgi:hypothetical protein